MKIKLISFSEKGLAKAEQIAEKLSEIGGEYRCESFAPQKYTEGSPSRLSKPLNENLASWTEKSFAGADGIVFVCACGIAVRAIAPFVKKKTEDPAVVAVDELGRYAVPLLSGHIGGANELAETIAEAIGARAVVTTATDINGKFSVDDFARKNNLLISDMKVAKKISAAALRGEKIGFICGLRISGSIPEGLIFAENINELYCGRNSAEIPELKICVRRACDSEYAKETDKLPEENTLFLEPRPYVLGMGCRRGKSAEEIESAAVAAAEAAGISMNEIGTFSSVDLKKDEDGFRKLCRKYKLRERFYSGEELSSVEGEFSSSAFVAKIAGTDNVCERAAAAAAGKGRLVVGKLSRGGVTAAIAVTDKENMEVRFE